MRLPRKEGLNIVPFIDIMLVLLAITLSVSTFIAQGLIKVDLPSAKSAQSPSEEKKITIKIDEHSQIFIDDIAVDSEALKSNLEHLQKHDLIVLENDKNSKFEAFVIVMDALKELNHENFAIVTKKDE
ncbi:TonB system transport protein ExbD [Campylobacter sp. VBCF_06 NA8]|uniref:TonB system transport protein ExbD n=1 Tax=unclassified Campylobacter TaxID=2593542 RepID=UPI0022E9F9AE|nr:MULTISPECIES: TonB system transport protein ExbD [unclassified Campylobacter]MDA3046266.1 TonB system transport protein ExbD [Campylobacter sp. VBCF_06 NA8]MDA3047159.1 TonB system transport protein ExbD [Campylobacter sp. JMF_08 NE1]MDA3049038.1 TonB system transport protein ExbD [Campylobacter sp. JMF_15 NE4]MDA3051537.1 TonB system transport protein ExbD [Campylobacter sp. JMF_02 ED1]